MSYKPDEVTWMAYLYGELESPEKEKVDQYLRDNAEAREQLESFRQLRKMMSSVGDKEVIAPPFFAERHRHWYSFFDTTYFRVLSGVAATLLLVLLTGWITDARMKITSQEFSISFGDPVPVVTQEPVSGGMTAPALTDRDVQTMINASLEQHNNDIVTRWEKSQEKLNSSITSNLAQNSARIDELVQQATVASRQEIQDYVALSQTQHLQQVQEYYQLNAADQKKYIEDLLVDFAKYLQQQRNDDLTIMQTRLNRIESNSNIFQQETEHILSSIISNANVTTIKN